MAVGDIYELTFHFEAPNSAPSLSMHYRETTQVVPTPGTVTIASAANFRLRNVFLDAISSDFKLSSIVGRKLETQDEPKWIQEVLIQAGTAGSPALPANCAALLGFFQATFGNRNNGRKFLPGVPEVQTDVGNIEAAFVNGPLADLAQALATPLVAGVDEEGEWEPGVINRAVLNAAPPAKDWSGAFAPISGWSVTPIVAIQRRRRTRVIGQAL